MYVQCDVRNSTDQIDIYIFLDAFKNILDSEIGILYNDIVNIFVL